MVRISPLSQLAHTSSPASLVPRPYPLFPLLHPPLEINTLNNGVRVWELDLPVCVTEEFMERNLIKHVSGMYVNYGHHRIPVRLFGRSYHGAERMATSVFCRCCGNSIPNHRECRELRSPTGVTIVPTLAKLLQNRFAGQKSKHETERLIFFRFSVVCRHPCLSRLQKIQKLEKSPIVTVCTYCLCTLL